jgi:hypothetical protein
MKFGVFNLGTGSSNRGSSCDRKIPSKTISGRRDRDLTRMETGCGVDPNVSMGMDEIDGKKADKYWARMKEQQDDSKMTYVDANAAEEYWQRLKSGCFDENESQEDVPSEISFSTEFKQGPEFESRPSGSCTYRTYSRAA